MYVRLLIASDKCTILHHILYGYALKKEEMSESSKVAQSLSPGKDGSCSAGTRHERTTAPKPMLLVSARTLQAQ